MYGKSTTQGVESINNADMALQQASIVTSFVLHVETDQKRHKISTGKAFEIEERDLVFSVSNKLKILDAEASESGNGVTFTNIS